MGYSIASGLVTTQKGMFVASGGPPSTQPPLHLQRRDPSQSIDVSYDQVNGLWTTSLEAGDYVVTLIVDDPILYHDRITLLPAKGSVFVYFGPMSGGVTVAWSADTAVVQRGDPKNPWPPPQTPTTELAPQTKAWFDSALKAIDSALPKSAEIGHHRVAAGRGA